MINIPLQQRNACPICGTNFGIFYLPLGDESQETAKTYATNQTLTGKISGTEKQRSIAQLNTYWKCCGFLAEIQSDMGQVLNRLDVDFEIKTRVAKDNPAMIKRYKMINGIVYIEPISIAFANLKHLEACRYFDKAFKIMGDSVGLTEDELIAKAKGNMG